MIAEIFTRPKHDFTRLERVDRGLGRTLCISRNWIYRGCMADPIFLSTFFVNFADIMDKAPYRVIFFGVIAVTQFVGDNFS